MEMDRSDMAALLADLLDAGEVAELLGLANRTSVHTYLHREHMGFPKPVVQKNSGKCLLWLRSDVEAWLRRREADRD